MRLILVSVAVLTLLGACSNGEKTARYLIDPPVTGGSVPNRLGTAELKDLSLPEYAAAGEVSWQTADGAVRSNTKELWADNPQRAVTQSLARAISDVSGATVIAEPWPLAEPPRRKIEVRVEQALARYQQAEVKRTTVDVEALGDAIVMRERDNSRLQRQKRQGCIEDMDVSDLLVDGVELVWNLIRSHK